MLALALTLLVVGVLLLITGFVAHVGFWLILIGIVVLAAGAVSVLVGRRP